MENKIMELLDDKIVKTYDGKLWIYNDRDGWIEVTKPEKLKSKRLVVYG